MPTVTSKSWVRPYSREQRYDSIGVQSDVTKYKLILLNHSLSGDSVKNWKAKIKSGQDASSPLTATREFFEWSPGSYFNRFWIGNSRVHSDNVTGVFPGIGIGNAPTDIIPASVPASVSTLARDVAESKAIKALYKKIRETHSQFAGGLFLAEIHKTAQMIRRPAMALQKAMLDYTRRQKSHIRKLRGKTKTESAGPEPLRKVLAGTYLEAVFGWEPLLSDIDDATKALARLVSERRHERFRAFGTGEEISHQQNQIISGFDLPQYNLLDIEKRVSTVVYYGSFLGHDPSKEVELTAQRVVELSGFDLRSFVPTVWELIPYSFLVDYFFNIGDMIEAATTDTSKVKRLTKVNIDEWTQTVKWAPNFSACRDEIKIRFGTVNRLEQSGSTGQWVVTRRTITRTPLTSVPFLTPRFDAPEIFSRHSLNIGALLAGARPGRL